MHSMEAPDKPGTALGTARYFQRLTREASAHYCVDPTTVIQCVQTKDVAYGAPNANRTGVHIELAGYAGGTAADWSNANALATMQNAAYLCGLILLPKFPNIPIEFVDADGLLAGKSGFTTHKQVSDAFGGTHWDPGPNFPMGHFLGWVKEARTNGQIG